MTGAAPGPGERDGNEVSALDVLAGEYVLGLLDDDAARAIEWRALTDPVIAAAIVQWQCRLDPLSDLPAPLAPSAAVWSRIAASLAPAHGREQAQLPVIAGGQTAPPPAAPRPSPWRGIAYASMAIAACLAAIIIWGSNHLPEAAPFPRAVALLSAPGSATAALRAQVTSHGTITVVPLRHLEASSGHQLGFWVWPASEKAPVLLGMIPVQGGQLRFPFAPKDGTPVMVTLENSGGPAGPAPGPTLYLGLLVAGPA
jgi:anti-sigma-K factor RskA